MENKSVILVVQRGLWMELMERSDWIMVLCREMDFLFWMTATPMYYWKMDGSSREKKGERIFISGDMVTIIRRLLLT